MKELKGLKEWAGPLTEAIALRSSVRAFAQAPLPNELLEGMGRWIKELPVPFEHNAKPQLFEAEPGKKLYNNGINPVNNLAVVSQTDLVSISKAGFVGELIMLHAVRLGLSACWFGHYKLAEVGRYIPGMAAAGRIKESTMGYGYGKHVDVGERVICCMPMGYKDETAKRLVDFVAGKNGAKRKPTPELLESPGLAGEIPAEIEAVLELAKLAPSAANSQMWRFGLHDGFKTITVAKPVGYKHFKWEHPDVDVGMCAAHIWLGLIEKGYMPKVDARIDADRAFWTFNVGNVSRM
ncbi:MAG: hypothetical protein LBS91_03500 [Clostridiales Family XIII bacterium]|jgi:nitroreductase|nr:hypothetical protein [Clostridiales Family XIII bacterium]